MFMDLVYEFAPSMYICSMVFTMNEVHFIGFKPVVVY